MLARNTKNTMTAARTLLALSWPALACHSGGDDDMGDVGQDDGDPDEELDRRACSDAWRELLEGGCPAGSAPQMQVGDPVSVALVDEVAVPICDGLGFLIDVDAVGGAQWVGYEFTKNSVCTLGCVVSYCRPGQDTCVGESTDGVCGAYCSKDIDEQSCRDFALGCSGIQPEDAEACEDREPMGG